MGTKRGVFAIRDALDRVKASNINHENIYVKLGDEFVLIGEVYPEDFPIIVSSIKKKYKLDLKFIMVLQDSELEAVRLLSPSEYRVFGYLRSVMSYENVVRDRTIREIAHDTGSTMRTVLSAMNTLERNNLIKREGPKIRRKYVINPGNSWKGNFHRQDQILGKFESNGSNRGQKNRR